MKLGISKNWHLTIAMTMIIAFKIICRKNCKYVYYSWINKEYIIKPKSGRYHTNYEQVIKKIHKMATLKKKFTTFF